MMVVVIGALNIKRKNKKKRYKKIKRY